jgi:hypothetical protein
MPTLATAAAHGPVEIRILGRAGDQEPAVGRDDVGREHVVTGEAVLAAKPADPA